MAFPFVGEKRRENDALRLWMILMWSKGELLRAEVSHHDASTARTLPAVESFFRTFPHRGEQSFPFPLTIPSHGEEDRACRGRALPAHLCLDPDPLSLRSGARSEVH